MTGSASNLTLKLVLHYDELKNVLRGALVEVSNPFQFDWAHKVGQKHV